MKYSKFQQSILLMALFLTPLLLTLTVRTAHSNEEDSVAEQTVTEMLYRWQAPKDLSSTVALASEISKALARNEQKQSSETKAILKKDSLLSDFISFGERPPESVDDFELILALKDRLENPETTVEMKVKAIHLLLAAGITFGPSGEVHNGRTVVWNPVVLLLFNNVASSAEVEVRREAAGALTFFGIYEPDSAEMRAFTSAYLKETDEQIRASLSKLIKAYDPDFFELGPIGIKRTLKSCWRLITGKP